MRNRVIRWTMIPNRRELTMATFFRKPDRRQRFLLPVDMLDWLPETDLVHLVLDAVEQMGLSAVRTSRGLQLAETPPCA
jgi:hypothetical protein